MFGCKTSINKEYFEIILLNGLLYRVDFYFEKQSPQKIFEIVLLKAENYEEESPLKHVKKNLVYTIQNHILKTVT